MIGKYCGDSIPSSHISSSNKILIHFKTNYHDNSDSGFKLEYNPKGESSGSTTTTSSITLITGVTIIGGGCQQSSIANGYCDDVNNNLDCSYDGGDCCGSNVNTLFCTECQCLEGGGGGGSTTTPSITLITVPTIIIGGCQQSWIADGYCDDINNNLDCSYDGGDCCGSNVNTQYCIQCQCLEGGGGSGSTTPSLITGVTIIGGTTTSNNVVIIETCYYQELISDGFCNDMNNNLVCSYDGGDCCGSNVNTVFCTECQCLEPGQSTTTSSTTTSTEACFNQDWIANGYCEDMNNNLACNYDGGDCCGSNVNTQYCISCQCLEGEGGGGSTTTLPSVTIIEL